MSKLHFKTNKYIGGELIAIDSEFDLPFDIKRIFYMLISIKIFKKSIVVMSLKKYFYKMM